MQDYPVGCCLQMCPKNEEIMRAKEKLVHPLETNGKLVKCFKRSAAGSKMTDPRSLRPPHILQSTVTYLLNDIAPSNKAPFPIIYDFLDDRLRSVRQDLFIQQCSEDECIAILEPIVRFYAYSAYRLCEENLDKFDPVLNHNQLLETLKCLLLQYDRCHYNGSSRIEMECLYHVMNLGETSPILRHVTLPVQLQRERLMKTVKAMSLSWFTGNFHRAIKLSFELPAVIQAVFCCMQLPFIQRYGFEVLNSAFCSKTLTMPALVIKKWLLFNSEWEVIEFGKAHGLNANDGDEKSLQFCKLPGLVWTKPSPRKRRDVDEKLEKRSLPEVLLSSCVDVH